jgi:hypothetical protein
MASHEFEEGAAPGTPASGFVAIYAKADGQMYSKDDAGVETPLGFASSAFLNALAGLSSNGIMVKTGTASAAVRTIQAGAGISVTNGDGISADPVIALPNTAVTAGTYGTSVRTITLTVDAQGRLTAAATNAVDLTPQSRTITAGAGLSGGGDLTADRTVSMPNVGTAGTYGSATATAVVTTDAQGRVSAAATTPITGVPAANITNTPSGSIAATNVQDAINELATEKAQDPTTTNGDIIYRDSGALQRLPIGTADQLLRVVSGLPAWSDENLGQDFGDGHMGNVTLSALFTAAAPQYYNTLKLDPGGIFITGGYPLYCKTLDLSDADAAAIHWNGNNGNNATTQVGGTAGAATTSSASMISGGAAGGAGASGLVGAGATGTVPGAVTLGNGGIGGGGGAGGSGNAGGNAGGVAGGASQVQASLIFGRFEQQFLRAATIIASGNGGRGGSSGGGDGVNLGRGGGGGGGAAGVIAIYADEIITSGSTPAGVIHSQGGNGGNGANGAAGNVGGGGGAGGGGGGYVYVAYNRRTGPAVVGAITSTGGNGGNGGNGIGTGAGGNGGNGGAAGRLDVINFGTLTGTHLNQVSGASGASASGVTGGTGGAGATNSVDL